MTAKNQIRTTKPQRSRVLSQQPGTPSMRGRPIEHRPALRLPLPAAREPWLDTAEFEFRW